MRPCFEPTCRDEREPSGSGRAVDSIVVARPFRSVWGVMIGFANDCAYKTSVSDGSLFRGTCAFGVSVRRAARRNVGMDASITLASSV